MEVVVVNRENGERLDPEDRGRDVELPGHVEHPRHERVADDARDRTPFLGLAADKLREAYRTDGGQLRQERVDVAAATWVVVAVFVPSVGEELEAEVAFPDRVERAGCGFCRGADPLADVDRGGEGDEEALRREPLCEPEDGVDVALAREGDQEGMGCCRCCFFPHGCVWFHYMEAELAYCCIYRDGERERVDDSWIYFIGVAIK
ncbi:limonoid UDP-glucosyltransferase isoform X1 [Iris pallida]|uniref:Limonoid UDP-glucosyltransferase isoform X1 n=1 Tax=Iris pallida TaxID=29817 RepID=A0AAX6H1K6_IRIPA|nr:limonoid UDP-glucosyltransferase isoform X1 [Iris pallida]